VSPSLFHAPASQRQARAPSPPSSSCGRILSGSMNSKLTPELRRLPRYCGPRQKDCSTSEQGVQGIFVLRAPARNRIEEARERRDPPRILSGRLLIHGHRSAIQEWRAKRWGRGKKKGTRLNCFPTTRVLARHRWAFRMPVTCSDTKEPA